MGLGFAEIAVILIVALVIFGPSRLPKLGKSMGEAIRGFKQGIDGLNEDKKTDVTHTQLKDGTASGEGDKNQS